MLAPLFFWELSSGAVVTENVETAIFEILKRVRQDATDTRASAETTADLRAEIDVVEQCMSAAEDDPLDVGPSVA